MVEVVQALKPCPFCGGEARLWPVIMPFDADCDDITVQCEGCNAIGATVLVDQDVHDQSDLPSLEAEAITAWNTRAHLTPNTDLSEHVADGVHEELWKADAALRTQRDEVIEECARVADAERDGRLLQKQRTTSRQEIRDYDTMAISATHIAAAIRNLKSQDEPR